ncbi:MAG: hypothetical protein JO271_07080, partial [Verrucomicrobia bacterium]|nr:hypothetical protein [Verrucomicrobiota bacterium]
LSDPCDLYVPYVLSDLSALSTPVIHQAGYLLDRQISSLERNFVRNGGIRERMTRARREYREREPGRGKRQPET